MRLAPELSIRRAPPPVQSKSGDGQPWCELLMQGVPTGRTLKGAYLESAVEADGCYLLMLTDDVPFEEFLTLVLLSPQMAVLDKASIGTCYGSGRFDAVVVLPGNCVQFRFLGERPWQVHVLPGPALRLPWRREPRGVWRRFGFWRHFVVSISADKVDVNAGNILRGE